jgi:hypothetical protein
MQDLTGKTIGQYQIVELIDEGGSAWVFKAFQPSMNRYVAVKVLKPAIANEPGAVDHFIRQSEVIAKLEHQGILPIYDVDKKGETVYRVSSYVETGTLGDHMYEYRDPRRALALINGLAETLGYIYSKGYMHGNLKPSNIFIDAVGKPILTDFGLHHPPGEAPSPYMSPEQVQGGAVDRRTDVYALGVLLYTMLTGEAPPPGVVVSLHSKRPDLPQSIEQVILKAMAQNPDARFGDALEFRNALDAALQPVAAGAPAAQAPPAAVQPPPAQPAKRTNWLAVLVGVILVLVLCIGAVIFFPGLRAMLPGGEPVPSDTPAMATEAPPVPTEAPPEATEAPPVDTQEPPTEEPPGEPQPTQLPPGWLEGICGDVTLFSGAAVLGVGLSVARRKKKSRHI